MSEVEQLRAALREWLHAFGSTDKLSTHTRALLSNAPLTPKAQLAGWYDRESGVFLDIQQKPCLSGQWVPLYRSVQETKSESRCLACREGVPLKDGWHHAVLSNGSTTAYKCDAQKASADETSDSDLIGKTIAENTRMRVLLRAVTESWVNGRRVLDGIDKTFADQVRLVFSEYSPEHKLIEPIKVGTSPRSLAEGANTAGRQHPSKVHDVGSNPIGDATFEGCPACAGAPNAEHVSPCSAQKASANPLDDAGLPVCVNNPSLHSWSVRGRLGNPFPEQLCENGCGLMWKNRDSDQNGRKDGHG